MEAPDNPLARISITNIRIPRTEVQLLQVLLILGTRLDAIVVQSQVGVLIITPPPTPPSLTQSSPRQEVAALSARRSSSPNTAGVVAGYPWITPMFTLPNPINPFRAVPLPILISSMTRLEAQGRRCSVSARCSGNGLP